MEHLKDAALQLLTEKIRENSEIIFVAENRDELFLIDIVDNSGQRVHLTFVFWDDSRRVTILIDAFEIVDEEFDNAEELLNLIKILLSNTVTKSEKIKNSKIIWRIYEYSMQCLLMGVRKE